MESLMPNNTDKSVISYLDRLTALNIKFYSCPKQFPNYLKY